jgi:hypothetical protein
VNGANPRAIADAMPAATTIAAPIEEPAVNPSAAIAAPMAAAASAAPANALLGGTTTPAGASRSSSSITPSARVSAGPGTNVADARITSVRPRRSARAGIATARSS